MVSHHGYVRARRTSPGRSLCKGCLLGNCLDGGGAGTKAHTVSIRVAGAKVVGGPAWRVLGVGSRGPHVRVCSHGSHPSWAVACQLTCRFERTRWLLPSVDPRFRWIIKPWIQGLGSQGRSPCFGMVCFRGTAQMGLPAVRTFASPCEGGWNGRTCCWRLVVPATRLWQQAGWHPSGPSARNSCCWPA